MVGFSGHHTLWEVDVVGALHLSEINPACQWVVCADGRPVETGASADASDGLVAAAHRLVELALEPELAGCAAAKRLESSLR